MRKFHVPDIGSISTGEQARLHALERYRILDSLPEQGYNDITELAAFICGTPISLISLVGHDRQWFKSAIGLSVSETPRDRSFCAHTIPNAQTLVVEDATADPRFRDNPLVTGKPDIRFYAGAPIVDAEGHVLGTVCVIDTHPRTLTPKQIAALEALSRQVLSLLEQRKTILSLEQARADANATGTLVRDNERRLQLFADSIPALAWMARADGWITFYNRQWYDYTGTTPEQMEGWGWQSVHDPLALPAVMERWTASIRTQQPFEMIFPLRGADGVLRPFLTRIVPIKDDAGALLQWFGTNTEIDELLRTRRALEASEAGLTQVLTATSDAVVSIDRTWTITYINPAAERLYGLAPTFVGRNFWQAFSNATPFREHYERSMTQGNATSFEAEYGDALGLILGVEVYPSIDGIVTFSRDITTLKHATAAVLQNEKLAAVGRLASSIAHEINNPLESVTNLLYLARHTEDPADLHMYLETADGELRRVAAITSQTLRFHRQSTRQTPIHPADLFDETIRLYQARLTNSSIHVERRSRDSRPVLCFAGEIRQVLSNLVVNAIDAMHPVGGRLLLRSREATHASTGQRGLAVTIADTGTGMPAAVRSRIFEAFFSTKGIGGTGLGMWISKEIVDRHQGVLALRSSDNPQHHGTVFSLFLPFDTSTP